MNAPNTVVIEILDGSIVGVYGDKSVTVLSYNRDEREPVAEVQRVEEIRYAGDDLRESAEWRLKKIEEEAAPPLTDEDRRVVLANAWKRS